MSGLPIPPDWVLRGYLPRVDTRALRDEDLDVLTEDILQAQSPDGRLAVDVGWYPESNRDGRFRCRVIEENDWENPVEKWETRDIDAVRQWLQEAISSISERLGRPGEISKEIVSTVAITVISLSVPTLFSGPEKPAIETKPLASIG